MGFLDRLQQAADKAQRAAQQQLQNVQRGSTPDQPPAQQPPPSAPAQPSPSPAAPVQAGRGDGPPFTPAGDVPQSFTLARALSGPVGKATVAWRRWPGSSGWWTEQMPHLGNERFQCLMTIPAGVAGASPLQLQLTLDPFRANGGHSTPNFGNEVVLREVQSGRTWRAGEQLRSYGLVVVNPDGVSGHFKHFYLRLPDRPRDRSSYVILDGDWRIAA